MKYESITKEQQDQARESFVRQRIATLEQDHLAQTHELEWAEAHGADKARVDVFKKQLSETEKLLKDARGAAKKLGVSGSDEE